MEGGRGARGASDGDEKEVAWRGASRHADQHGQSGVDVQESRPMEGGRGARRASDGDEKEGAWRGASRHAEQHGQLLWIPRRMTIMTMTLCKSRNSVAKTLGTKSEQSLEESEQSLVISEQSLVISEQSLVNSDRSLTIGYRSWVTRERSLVISD